MHIPHELPEEFPDETALIERLARDNYVFKRLAVRYDDVNRQIHRIESEDQPAEDAVLERLKKRTPQAQGRDRPHAHARRTQNVARADQGLTSQGVGRIREALKGRLLTIFSN
jgi:uncharacterized protein YdcH (DUF465 family)